jgi:HAD superfamily hydrolase (TIGR01509 family)
LSDAERGVTPLPLQLVIFDCDGVLVDSEPAARRLLADEAARLGWNLTEEAAAGFKGLRWSDLQPVFEQATRSSLGSGWPSFMQSRLIAHMAGNITVMPGAADALRATTRLGIPFRVASNSSHAEMAAKFAATGLTNLVSGRLHSARDVRAGKPSPDVFLAAAAAQPADPEACLVIEDSRPGVMAARAAGMTCLAYIPHGDQDDLLALGARPLHDLAALPGLLQAASMGNVA